VIIGDFNVGKTCLVRKYVQGIFYTGTRQTVGVDFAIKAVSRDGVPVTLQLWDIAGQERFRGMTRIFYDNAVGAAIVADITDPQTLKTAELWKQDLDAKVFVRGTRQPLPALLLLNKCDLGRSVLTDAELDDWCAKHKFKGWLAVSARRDERDTGIREDDHVNDRGATSKHNHCPHLRASPDQHRQVDRDAPRSHCR
jgi:small GTP-binding protein